MDTAINSPELIAQLIKAPETVIEQLDLVYLYDHQLHIVRAKHGKDFIYEYKGKPVKTKQDLARIKSLVIPPAWANVKISSFPQGHLQAIGRDSKNRKQYRYHPLWSKIRNQTKFYKMISFGKQLPKIREQVDKDLEQEGFPKTKVIALIIRLMEETHIRIGNDQYAKRNKTYGLSTMRNRHVRLYKDKLKFEFVGKRGKNHSVTLRNKKLINLVNRCEEIPGWELFQYYDEHGDKQKVESSMVNEYLHTISGDIFTAKDFRTWAGTNIFFETLMNLGIGEDEKATQKNILLAYDTTARELGNTRNVCKKYYVHPIMVNSYEDGSIEKTFNKVAQTNELGEYLSASEQAILDLLESYEPEFLKNS